MADTQVRRADTQVPRADTQVRPYRQALWPTSVERV
jgi:hypothetical protein